MTQALNLTSLLKNSFDNAIKMVVPSLPYAILFAFAVGYLVWAAEVLPESGLGYGLFAAFAFAVLYAHSLFSASMYRVILPRQGTLRASAWQLLLAWLLLITATAIILFILSLFFSLFSVILIAISGYDPTEGDPTDVTGSLEAMRESGAIWLLYALLATALVGLCWYAIRVMTFAAATTSRAKVHVFRTWGFTKGHLKLLAPAMLILIVLPIGLLGGVVSLLPAATETSLARGFSASLQTLILLPSAWIGHGFAAEVYRTTSQ